MEAQNTPEKETAIEKALDLLDFFIPYNRELSSSEITSLCGYHRATSSRMIKTLERKGYLYQNPDTKKYRLGYKVPMLNSAITSSLASDLSSIGLPVLMKLREQTDETVVLDTITYDSTVPSFVLRGKGPIFIDIMVGTPVPWNTSPGLLAILAFSDAERRQPFFLQPMVSITDTSIIDMDVYLAELEETAKRGYAVSVDDPFKGATSFCAPVFDHNNSPIAAISVSAPSDRARENREFLTGELLKAAAEFSKRLSLK